MARRLPSVRLVVGVVLALAAFFAVLTTGGGGGDVAEFAPVVVRGEVLPPFQEPDSASGRAAPRLAGQDFDGRAVLTDFDVPTLFVFVAHWCPHCRRELPRIVAWRAQGGGAQLRVVAVSTGQKPGAVNWPPSAWLERESWRDEVLLDDEAGSAAAAYGLSAYPFFALVGADGRLVVRASGELDTAALDALAATAGVLGDT